MRPLSEPSDAFTAMYAPLGRPRSRLRAKNLAKAKPSTENVNLRKTGELRTGAHAKASVARTPARLAA